MISHPLLRFGIVSVVITSFLLLAGCSSGANVEGTVTLDGQGNLNVNNAQCEGIQSAALPAAAPQF